MAASKKRAKPKPSDKKPASTKASTKKASNKKTSNKKTSNKKTSPKKTAVAKRVAKSTFAAKASPRAKASRKKKSAKKKTIPKAAAPPKPVARNAARPQNAASASRGRASNLTSDLSRRSLDSARARSGGQAGDLQGLIDVEGAATESVDELLEEGNAFEAGIVSGVESADNADEEEVHTHEVLEDDVPDEYLEKE